MHQVGYTPEAIYCCIPTSYLNLDVTQTRTTKPGKEEIDRESGVGLFKVLVVADLLIFFSMDRYQVDKCRTD